MNRCLLCSHWYCGHLSHADVDILFFCLIYGGIALGALTFFISIAFAPLFVCYLASAFRLCPGPAWCECCRTTVFALQNEQHDAKKI